MIRSRFTVDQGYDLNVNTKRHMLDVDGERHCVEQREIIELALWEDLVVQEREKGSIVEIWSQPRSSIVVNPDIVLEVRDGATVSVEAWTAKGLYFLERYIPKCEINPKNR